MSQPSLVAANAARSAKKELRERVKARAVNMREVLEDPPDFILRMPIVELLMWIPRVGRDKSRIILRSVRPPIDPQATLSIMSVERREALIAAIVSPRTLE